MVQQGDFEVHLVEAQSKTPFKEFYKDGQTFVEVEPDAEYFIGVRKVKKNADHDWLVLLLDVDGKFLGYRRQFIGSYVSDGSHLMGIWSFENGISTDKALKIFTPSKATQQAAFNQAEKMPVLHGEVKVKVYKGIYVGQTTRESFTGSFSPSDTGVGNSAAGLPKKLHLRSAEGNEATSFIDPATVHDIHLGDHLYTITLKYCSTLGLVEAGVLPRVGATRSAKRPATASVTPIRDPKKIRKVVVTKLPDGKQVRQVIEHDMFDLTSE